MFSYKLNYSKWRSQSSTEQQSAYKRSTVSYILYITLYSIIFALELTTAFKGTQFSIYIETNVFFKRIVSRHIR